MRKRPPTMNRRRPFDRQAARRDAQCKAQSLEVIATARALEASAPCSCGECDACVDLALLGGIAATLASAGATLANVTERVRTARKRPKADERPVAAPDAGTATLVVRLLCGFPAILRRAMADAACTVDCRRDRALRRGRLARLLRWRR